MTTKKIKTAGNAVNISSIPKTPVRFLLHVSKPHKTWAFLAIFVVVFASALGQSTNIFFKLIIDAAERGDTQTVLIYVLLFPVVVLVVQLLYRVSGLLGKNWSIGVEKDSYDTLVAYSARHSHGYYIDRFAGSILSKVSNVVRATSHFIPDFLWVHLSTFVTFIITYIFIARIDVLSGVLFLALIIVLVVVNKFLAPEKMKLSKINAEANTRLRGNTVDLFANATAMRQHSMVNKEVFKIGKDTKSVKDIHNKSWAYTEKVLILNSFILFFFSLGMFYILVTRWGAGDITTGEFVFIIALVSQITGTLIFIGRAFNETSKALGEAEEGLEDLLVPHEITDVYNATSIKVTGGEIVYKDVCFEYESGNIFDDFSVTIKPGQRVGLVGPSGAGKTTFVSLLLRQHDVQKGCIEIDGQNIAKVTQDSLRRAISVVPQEPMLFHRSIFDNITYGKPLATKKEVEEVARRAQAHDFISALPQKYKTLVGERGVKLSGGQRQRIAIARAMLKNSPILVLDEATSSLDSESEVAIQKALNKLMAGKTVVAIAHRLSTLRRMDRILVIDKGKVVEDGTHNELSKSGGIYQRLWEHQAGGFVN